MKAELLSSPTCSGCDPIPDEFSVNSAYPNPFNGRLTFDIQVPEKKQWNFKFLIYVETLFLTDCCYLETLALIALIGMQKI